MKIARPRSLTSLVLDQIRALIIEGELQQGEQLSESVLGERLGVSRTPVREAFVRLEAERLVEVRPQRGTFVFTCDAAMAREICELREVLETGALRVAWRRDRDALIAVLEGEVAAASTLELHDARDFLIKDASFHTALVEVSRNRQLIEAYQSISGRIWTLRGRFGRTLEEIEDARAEHAQILDEVVSNNAAAAEALLRRHVYNSYRVILRHAASQAATPDDGELPAGEAMLAALDAEGGRNGHEDRPRAHPPGQGHDADEGPVLGGAARPPDRHLS